MTPLSSRYAIPLAILFGAALVPVTLAHTNPTRFDPCATPELLRVTSLIPGSHSLGERLEDRTESVIQWSEGQVENPVFDRLPLEFQIVRSYDSRRFYVRPSTLVDRNMEVESQLNETVETASGPLTITWVVDDTHQPVYMVAYAFVYDGQSVESPVRARLNHALELLGSGSRPLTLLLVSGHAPPRRTDVVEDAMRRWLVDAWEFHRKTCAG